MLIPPDDLIHTRTNRQKKDMQEKYIQEYKYIQILREREINIPFTDL